jgi:hypothetical protein
MKPLKKNLIIALMSVMIFSCNSATNDYSSDKSSAPSTSDYDSEIVAEEMAYDESAEYSTKSAGSTSAPSRSTSTSGKDAGVDYGMIVSSSAATDRNIDSKRKIVRTADLNFRTPNVAMSTYAVEQIIAKFGGWVSTSYLASSELLNYKVKVSEDSTLVVRKYVVSNTMVVRTPFESLDTTLKSLVPLIEYLDYRNITAEDVTFKQLEKELQQKRLAEYNARMKRHTATTGGRLSDVTEAERQILQQQERADAAMIEELKIYDKILYSTINIHMYESEKYEYTMIANPDEIQSYKPNFGRRLLDSLLNGWYIIQEIIIFLMNLWGVVLLGFLVFFGVRYVSRKYFRKNKNQ